MANHVRALAHLALGRSGGGSALSGLCSSGCAVSSSSSSSASSGGAWQPGWQAIRRRCFSNNAGQGVEGKSILDGQMMHGSTMGAAEQRLSKIKATEEHTAGGAGGEGQPSVFRQALRLIGRGVIVAGIPCIGTPHACMCVSALRLHAS